jgi:hypothetical protein
VYDELQADFLLDCQNGSGPLRCMRQYLNGQQASTEARQGNTVNAQHSLINSANEFAYSIYFQQQ